MKISDYKINKVDPKSCGELITTVHCKHYGFECEGKVYTCVGELEKTHIVSAKLKMICKWIDKDGCSRKTTYYDSTAKDLSDTTIDEFIRFELNDLYRQYKNKM